MSNGDWMCSSCQHSNFKKRETCQRCRYPKFGGGTDMAPHTIAKNDILAGDWYCNTINCGAHNYASRPSCYRCGNTRNEHCNCIGSMINATAYMYDNRALPGWKSGTGFAIDLDAACTIMQAGRNVLNAERQGTLVRQYKEGKLIKMFNFQQASDI